MPVDPEVATAVDAAGLTVLAPTSDGLGHDGGLIVEAPLHNSAVRALAQRPGFSVSPSGPEHSVVWRVGWCPIVVDRAQHHADMERIDAGDLAGTDTVTVFATLRDIADAEPVQPTAPGSVNTCAMCGVRHSGPPPHPHLISCPWHRATQIVGVQVGQATPAAAAAVCRCGHYEYDHETRGWRACSRRDTCGCQLYTERGADDRLRQAAPDPRLYPDVEVSTDAGVTWSPFPLAPLASLRLTVSDGQVHDDGRGHLYRAVGSDG